MKLTQLRFRGFPIATRKMALLPSACGEKKLDHVVIEERQPRCAETERVRREIHLAAEYAASHWHGAIAAISHAIESAGKIREEEDVDASVSRQLLLQSEMVGLRAKCAGLEKLERIAVAVEAVCAGFQAIDCVHDEIDVIELGARRSKEIGRDAACARSRMVESCGKVIIALLSNRRVEPRRKTTCSIVSCGSCSSGSGWSFMPFAGAGGGGTLPRQSSTSCSDVSDDASCISSMPGYSTSRLETGRVARLADGTFEGPDRRWCGHVSDRHQAERDLTSSIEVEQLIHIRVDEAEDDF